MSSIEEIRGKFIIDKNKVPENKDTKGKKYILLNISKLVEYRKKQAFSLYGASKYEEVKNSIKKNGVLDPIIVRKIENEKYEIIAGHNRVNICKDLGIEEIPSIIVNCSDDEAELIMIDTNLMVRDKILPVEKGYAYKRRNDIIKNGSNNNNINNFDDNSTEWNEEGKSQVYNYIRLTELIETLQEKVNMEQIPIKAGVEISYLNNKEQEIVNQVIEDEKRKINVAQAQKIRTQKNNISYEVVLKILRNQEEKNKKFTGKIEKRAYKIYKDKFKNDKEFTDLIMELLEEHFRSKATF